MNPISVFDLGTSYNQVALAGFVDDYENASFSRSWTGVGAFSISINYFKSNASVFSIGRIVMFGTDEREVGIITEIKKTLSTTGRGGQTVSVIGIELKGIFSQRIVYPDAGSARYVLHTNAESVIKTAVSRQCGPTVVDTDRRIDLLSIGTNLNRGATFTLSARYTNLLEELKACSSATMLGWYVSLDRSAQLLVLECAEGVDRTAGQSINPRAIFSTDYDTLRSANIHESKVFYKNVAIVGGTGEGAARTITLVPSSSRATDLDRREMFVDARDLTAGYLSDRGIAKLSAAVTVNFLEGTALAYSPLVLGDEYDLGDIVTLSAFGTSYDARITTVRENFAPLTYDVELSFGLPYPELPSTINSQMGNYQNLLNASETP